jgi:hypothetical protein
MRTGNARYSADPVDVGAQSDLFGATASAVARPPITEQNGGAVCALEILDRSRGCEVSAAAYGFRSPKALVDRSIDGNSGRQPGDQDRCVMLAAPGAHSAVLA